MVDEKYEKAKKRVEEIKSSYSHLIVYVAVNIVLIIINLVTRPGGILVLLAASGMGYRTFLPCNERIRFL